MKNHNIYDKKFNTLKPLQKIKPEIIRNNSYRAKSYRLNKLK